MEAAAECEATEHLLSSALTPVERRVVELFYGLAEHDSHTVPQVAAVQGCTLNEVRSNPNPNPSPSPNPNSTLALTLTLALALALPLPLPLALTLTLTRRRT